ncbi:MAG: GMC family oxidoreductase [Saprospiraceae bacterium]
MQLKEKATTNQFDAIVIGSGMSGGWAAKELCEAGFKTLVLERGPMVRHGDYPTALWNPWDIQHRGQMKLTDNIENPVINKCYAYNETTEHFFVKDTHHPYEQEKPFDWIRGYQVGGKSLLWARQTQRWSKYDFEAPARDGYAVDWPIRYKDIEPWYTYVEKFVGICGDRDGLDVLPDSEVMPGFELNCVEKVIQEKIHSKYENKRHVIIGRCAHLTEPKEIHLQQGRGKCQTRNLCERGCPYGGYFSSVSSTIPWALKTGNLTLRPDSVVHSIVYDETSKRASGVKIIDAKTNESTEFFAKIIFVNAATINSNLILLNSSSARFPNGLGNDHDVLGRYIAFHNYRGNVSATMNGFEDKYYYGRRPTQAFIPSFRNVYKQETDFLRGYMGYYVAHRPGWHKGYAHSGIGEDLKSAIKDPGHWQIAMGMQGETIPRFENRVKLSETNVDKWGIPQIITSVGYTDNDEKMIKDFITQGSEMLESAGCKITAAYDNHQAPGLDIHEMGGVRMGHEPKTSMLNAWNQIHSCKNVFVTDGACMTSTGFQNPSLTFMAITARAAHHAIEELKKGNL